MKAKEGDKGKKEGIPPGADSVDLLKATFISSGKSEDLTGECYL